MSSSYWPIIGIGWKIDWNLLDLKKYLHYAGASAGYIQDICEMYKSLKDYINSDENDISLFEDFCEILNNIKEPNIIQIISYLEECEAGSDCYLIYAPANPWHMSNFEKELTEDKVNNLLCDMIMKLTTDDIPRQEIMSNICEINSYGISG